MLEALTFTLALSLVHAGCAHYKKTFYRIPEKLPPELISYYDYPPVIQDIQVKIHKETPSYVIKRAEFPMSVPAELMKRSPEELRTEWARQTEKDKRKGADLEYKVRVDFFEVRSDKPLPLIVLSPILGGDNQLADLFADFFAKQGFHAAVLHRYKLKIEPHEDLGQVERYLRMSVMRARQGIDWLFTQESVDKENVGTFGISFGGITNTFLAGIDHRLKCHVIAMAGGNLAHVVVNCPENSIRPYVEYMIKEKGWTKKKLQSALHQKLRTDTLTFAKAINPETVLMFIGLFDHVIGRKNSRNLWKAMGEPETVYFPFGHYSSVVVMPYIASKSLKFFRKKFYGSPPLGNQGIYVSGIYRPVTQ